VVTCAYVHFDGPPQNQVAGISRLRDDPYLYNAENGAHGSKYAQCKDDGEDDFLSTVYLQIPKKTQRQNHNDAVEDNSDDSQAVGQGHNVKT
jgi:hypothetical protein